MGFNAVQVGHGEKAPWTVIMHVRLTGLAADTDQGKRVINHIKQHADDQGVAAIARIEPSFPARKKNLGARRAMEYDLRHMANRRDAGTSEQNKGLLELGWIE
jgi:hypothetical protein